MTKIKKRLIYAVLLCLGIFGSVQADDEVNVKIDFARVQDASGDKPKTAACIVVWLDGNTEENVFCRYQLEKQKNAEKFFRDNTEVDKIFSSQNKLLKATPTSFPAKIDDWLTNIETSSSAIKKIAPLFAEFVKQGVMEYSQYSGYNAALFKHTKPYNLFLSPKLGDLKKITYPIFALLAHNQVHYAVSTPTPRNNNDGPQLPAPIKTLLANTEVQQSLNQPKIQEILKDNELVDILTGFKDTSAIHERLTKTSSTSPTDGATNSNNDNPPPTSTLLSQDVIAILIIVIVILLFVVIIVIFWTSGGSQKKMNEIIEENQKMNDSLSRQIKAVTQDTAKTPPVIDNDTNKQLIAQITNIIRQQITVDDIVTKVARNVSEQTKGIKKDIFTLIKTEKNKVEKERKNLTQKVAKSEQSQKEAEQKLTSTEQVLTQTEEKLTQTQSELVEVKKRQERMHKSLESLMLKRFRVIKPTDISIDDLLAQLTKQGGTWQWYQQVLSSQYEACANAMKQVQALNNPECNKITKLLNIDNILLHWREFITENPFFESDDKLLGRMFAINGGTWLSNVFRADDLLKTYFAEIEELKPLANRLAVTAMMLEAALQELGVKVIKPELFQKPSVNLPESAYKSASNPLLMELTHDKVMSKLSDKEPQLVVDIEKYGFVTPKNPEPSMTILYADLAGWEGY
jgi:hypothetical protein